VRDLKRAGVYGFTFHVDSHQARPGWVGKNENELNELRQHFADMIHRESELVCAFNTTIFPDSLEFVPEIVYWAIQNVKKVQILTLIAVRMISPDTLFDYYVHNKKVDLSRMAYFSSNNYQNLTTLDIYKEIKKVDPDFEFCAYLGGTALPNSLKWTIGCRIGTSSESFGNIGAKSIELLQYFRHLTRNRYLAYTKPRLNRSAKLLFFLSLFDPKIRMTAKKYFLAAAKKPALLLKKLYTQSINVLQPVDILPNGEEDMCDGCPNKTIWKDKLVSACRLDDYLKFGAPVHAAPRREKAK